MKKTSIISKLFILVIAILGVNLFILCSCDDYIANFLPHDHIFGEWETVKESTCREDGEKQHSCFVCGEVESESILKKPHTEGEWQITKDATCAQPGMRQTKCTSCGEIVRTETITALGHTEEILPAVDATCTEEGLTEGKKCSVCEEVTLAQETVAALGHNYVNGSCSSCGESEPNLILTPDEYFDFTLLDDGTYSIKAKDVNNMPSKVVIPSVYGGKVVTAIGNYAFAGCSNLTNVIIPDSVTSIGNMAFIECSIKNVVIPESVLFIDYAPFASSTVETIFVKENNPNYYSQNNCLIEKSTRTLVAGCKNSIIPDDVVYIGAGAFGLCSDITSISIPNSVIAIYDFAFAGCTNLSVVIIGDGLASIDVVEDIFELCYSITRFEVSENNQYFKSINGNLYSKDGKTLERYAMGKKDTHFEVPYGVVTMDNYAFNGCPNLTNVIFPDSVTNITGFYDCPNLTNVVFPDSVTQIDGFHNCPNLTSIVIPCSVTSFGWNSFSKSLNNIYYSGTEAEWNKISIDYYTNNNIKSATRYYYSETQPTTEGNFWHYVDGVPTVWPKYSAPVYSEGLKYTSNGDGTCYVSGIGNYKDKNLVIPEVSPQGWTVTGIGDYAFENCHIENVEYPTTITHIGSYAFHNSALKNIIIPDNVTSLGNSPFMGCSNAKTLVIGKGITAIYLICWSGCSSVVSLTIGENVTYIGSGPTSLAPIEIINKSLLDLATFNYETQNLVSNALEVHTGETKIVNYDDYLFYTHEGTNYLLGYVGDETDLVLPESYKGESYEIYRYAFYGNKSIASIEITGNVTSIGYAAFYNCSNLSSVVIGDSVTSIGDSAFYYCENLTNVIIGDDVTSIGSSAFSNCSNLENVVIGNSITIINSYAFSYCYNLTTIVIPSSITSIAANAFYSCNSLETVYFIGTHQQWLQITINYDNSCITNATRYYYSDDQPSIPGNFWHYVNGEIAVWPAYISPNIPEPGTYSQGLEYTSNYDGTCSVSGFGTCVDSDVIIPAFSPIGDKVVSIKRMVLRYDVKSIFIPEGVIEIEDYAFDCTYATKFYLPKTLKVIGYEVFHDTGYASRDFYYNGTLEDWFKIDIKTSNGHIFGHNGGNLYLNGELLTELTIDESTNTANLSGCKSLTTVIFADGVTSIRNDLFYGWHGLDNVVIPDSVTSIGNNAFYSCDSLTSIVIPDSVTSIGEFAFSGCSSLESVIIGNGVTSISNYAFSSCQNLKSVVIGSSVTSIKNSAFSYCYALEALYYVGSSSSWNKVIIENNYDYNSYLINAPRYYYSETQPTTEGNFWHWVDGEPVAW